MSEQYIPKKKVSFAITIFPLFNTPGTKMNILGDVLQFLVQNIKSIFIMKRCIFRMFSFSLSYYLSGNIQICKQNTKVCFDKFFYTEKMLFIKFFANSLVNEKQVFSNYKCKSHKEQSASNYIDEFVYWKSKEVLHGFRLCIT